MKKQDVVLLVFLFGTLLLQSVAAKDMSARQRQFGLGVLLGEPTAVSYKTWLTGNTAVDAALGWSFRGRGFLHIHGDYLLHRINAVRLEEGAKFTPFYGLGGMARFEDDTHLAARFPVGIAYLWEGTPLEFFFELVPMLDLAPATDFSLNGGLGFRYYF